jgi:hypothetical protein
MYQRRHAKVRIPQKTQLFFLGVKTNIGKLAFHSLDVPTGRTVCIRSFYLGDLTALLAAQSRCTTHGGLPVTLTDIFRANVQSALDKSGTWGW